MKFKILLVLSYWAPKFCAALVADYNYLNSPVGPHISRQDSGQELPPCLTVCSPTSCGGSQCTIGSRKRSLLEPSISIINDTSGAVGNVDVEHHELSKRVLQLRTRRQSSAYLEAQSASVPPGNQLCPQNAGGYYFPTFCVQSEFVRLPTSQQTIFGTALTELTGCTVLTIVSSRAVYMCHIWEDLHFSQTQRPAPARTIRGFQPVLDLIRNGGGPNTLDAAGPALNVNLFNKGERDNTYAFISTPRAWRSLDDPTTVEHAGRIGQLSNLIQNLLPNALILQRNYRVARGNENYEFGFGGVALFEYDPDADGNGNADWRLWYEDTNGLGSSLGQNVE